MQRFKPYSLPVAAGRDSVSVTRPPGGASERRFNRSSLLIVALALALLLAGVAQKAYRLSLPTTGWNTLNAINSNIPVFERNLLGAPSPLRSGDRFVALEGMDLKEIHARSASGRSSVPANYAAGERVQMTVMREGRQLELSVPLYNWTGVAVRQAVVSSLRTNVLTWLGLLIAVFVFWRRPENTAARLMFLYYVTQVTIFISWLLEPSAGHSLSDLLSPTSYALMGFFSHAMFGFVLAPLILHLCLSFPEPKALVRRFPGLLVVVYVLPWLLLVGAGSLVPTLESGLETAGYLLVGTYSLLGAAALVHTFATVQGPVRRAQVRWVAFGFAVLSLHSVGYALGALSLLDGPLLNAVVAFPTSLVLTVCLAVAVLRYRLFDIDVVINRTLVYGALSACIVGLYVVAVGALGTLFNGGNLTVSLLATGLIAVLFQPLRERLQRVVNRAMYGRRDEPYALLAKLSQKVEGSLTPEQVLPTSLETVTQALRLPYASVLLHHDEGSEMVAEHGNWTDFRADPKNPVAFSLVHQGETFGELRLLPRGPGEAFSTKELNLLKTIAQQVSVAAYAVRQTLDLRRSRERLITSREEERLRIRRDLHDGLGPTLAGLHLQAGSLNRLIKTEPEVAQVAVDELRGELRKAVGEVRQLVHDLRPPSLDQLGLKGALEGLAASLGAPGCEITTDIPALPPLSPATEVAVYRITQEALTNAVKHARAHRVAVTLKPECDLNLVIRDDGVGIPEHYRAGVGLRSIRERAEELRGSFEIAHPCRGTTLYVRLPYGRA